MKEEEMNEKEKQELPEIAAELVQLLLRQKAWCESERRATEHPDEAAICRHIANRFYALIYQRGYKLPVNEDEPK